ncbi:MAG TPA: hypothetical protein VHL77_10620, partial [Ferruginibacter sp.]|nr:hypothetical protein [Ferruginibacter sp.]
MNIDVTVLNPCDGTSNGSVIFKVNAANGGVATVAFVFDGTDESTSFPVASIPVGNSFTYNPGTSISGNYDFFISDNASVIRTPRYGGSYPRFPLVDLPTITSITTGTTDLFNESCSPLSGQIEIQFSGGSITYPGFSPPAMTAPAAVTSVPSGGSFKVTWSSDNSLTGLPLVSNTVTGTTPITLNLATQLTAAGFPTTALPGGVYTVLIEDNYSDCSYTQNFTVVDDVPNAFTISTTDAALCEGEDFSMQIDNPSDPGVTYEVLDGTGPSAPVIATVMGTGGAVIVPPISGLSVGTHTIRVKASLSSCTP